jgi:hypothetical protein
MVSMFRHGLGLFPTVTTTVTIRYLLGYFLPRRGIRSDISYDISNRNQDHRDDGRCSYIYRIFSLRPPKLQDHTLTYFDATRAEQHRSEVQIQMKLVTINCTFSATTSLRSHFEVKQKLMVMLDKVLSREPHYARLLQICLLNFSQDWSWPGHSIQNSMCSLIIWRGCCCISNCIVIEVRECSHKG